MSFDRIADFVFSESSEIPDDILAVAARLLVDTAAVTAGAAELEVGRIIRDFAADMHGPGAPEWAAPMMFDGRRVSLPGAAFAAATQTDNLDAHDGFNPVKGHIGCAAAPALFAVSARLPALTGRDALAAFAIAYEVAGRAGLALHATVSDYHTSGAWNALGVAAMAVRLLGGDAGMLRHALGIAEYHGPRSQMMREIANPTMLHDGSGPGAFWGLNAAILAMRGFTGAPAVTVEDAPDHWADLGLRWTIVENYIKPYPVCRWAHAAIDAVRALTLQGLTADAAARIEIRTFAEAARLFPGMPTTTSEAQYSLGYAVATMLRKGRVGPEEVTGAALSDPETAAILSRITVIEEQRHCDRFPEGRWSDVMVETTDGRRLESGDVAARGGVETPLSEAEFTAKVMTFAAPAMGDAGARELIALGFGLADQGALFAPLAALCARPAP